MAYYTAGCLLAQTGSEDYNKSIKYFNLAYDMNPESDAAQNIKMSSDYMQKLLAGETENKTETEQSETQVADDSANIETSTFRQ